MATSNYKTLVIGSTKHQHVRCINWDDINSVNIVDFHVVVINTSSLDAATIKRLHTAGKSIRTSLARLWVSGGDIVVLGSKRITVKIRDGEHVDNYFWSPLIFSAIHETGDTIERLSMEFNCYLSKLTRWKFFYHVPGQYATPELITICGTPQDGCYYRRATDIYLTNRYNGMLSGTFVIGS